MSAGQLNTIFWYCVMELIEESDICICQSNKHESCHDEGVDDDENDEDDN